ncbi:MAG: hypothetical protein AB8B50_17145 [Pirellulaceae bacterium]
MKRYSEYFLALLLAGILAAIYTWMGIRVFNFALGLAAVWFVISIVLLSRPPGIPEFVSDQSDPDEQHITRKDVIPTLGILDRVRLSLSVACGACLLLWLSLVLLAK